MWTRARSATTTRGIVEAGAGWRRRLNLERLGDGRALLVTQPLGEAPSVSTFDKIDRAWNKTQRPTRRSPARIPAVA